MGILDNGLNRIKDVYDKKYKLLLIIPFALLIFSILQISYQVYSTGDFLNKDVSLKGGITFTVPVNKDYNEDKVTQHFSSRFQVGTSTRVLTSGGKQIGIILQAEIDPNNEELSQKFLKEIESYFGITDKDYSIEVTGPTLGRSFFVELLLASGLAFLLMSIVVFISFRTFIPSMAVILAAFSDILFALAMTNALNIKIGAGGIAAFLMLIGYSVDTDILLSTRVLKRAEGTVFERIVEAYKTGITMTITAIAAVTIGLVFTQSEVIRQIMFILLMGLLADIPNTWIQNVGILRLYLERKEKKMQVR